MIDQTFFFYVEPVSVTPPPTANFGAWTDAVVVNAT